MTERTFLAALAFSLCSGLAGAHQGPLPLSLKGVPLPSVPGLIDGADPIVVDRAAAIALGKALFWDSNVGSDGMACASCHFHAGADVRVKNQVAPRGQSQTLDSGAFEPGVDGNGRGANYVLRRGDFPLTEAAQPLEAMERYGMLRSSDDVVGSAGTFGGRFDTVQIEAGTVDLCDRAADDIFHVRGTGARRVTRRNAPSVINAVFNHRNFWDGRAQNVFNGSSSWGERDPDAGVWVLRANAVVKERLHLVNSSLASLALAPPVDTTEMSCAGRTFADLGRKLMFRRPLENQRVHPDDSVLGAMSFSRGTTLRPGLNTWYSTLIRKAFNRKYWSYGSRGQFGSPPSRGPDDAPLAYSQLEANFGMFFALSLQLYQSTLVADDSPFDRSQRDGDGQPIDLSPAQQRGMVLFREAHCNQCHVGPAFTSVALDALARQARADRSVFGVEFPVSATGSVVTRFPTLGGPGFQDAGFMATGVAHDDWDVGVAGQDPWGNPFAFAAQYADYLAGNLDRVVDPEVRQVRACDMALSMSLDLPVPSTLMFTRRDGLLPQPVTTENCFNPAGAFVPTAAAAQVELANVSSRKMRTALTGSFKVPGLRNVELTGPYMHNGSMATLEQVVEFYTRGGNFDGHSKQVNFVFEQSILHEPEARADLVEFLKSLTDDRVRYSRAPFDHPELVVPHGHRGDHVIAPAGGGAWGSDLAADEFLVIPAVGATGLAAPLDRFEDRLLP
ncbi:cytochrome-c peroxidase [Methyloversatilis discipulorum]|uniref:cytochrome-c peroxidase n=1 Tax=Methyloversatilis discipulorum TaxID=1119528 RepID=UPI001A525730|nr:cytochrome c peroxidase [Methyloversatilis discipulorum]MBL8469597.1 cytochrome-c peroxidase [Methyloversatilis discipulorum]